MKPAQCMMDPRPERRALLDLEPAGFRSEAHRLQRLEIGYPPVRHVTIELAVRVELAQGAVFEGRQRYRVGFDDGHALNGSGEALQQLPDGLIRMPCGQAQGLRQFARAHAQKRIVVEHLC